MFSHELFCARLKELRLEKGAGMQELAEALGVVRSTYNQWELGTRYPAYAKLYEIAQYFDVSLDYLFGLSERQKP